MHLSPVISYVTTGMKYLGAVARYAFWLRAIIYFRKSKLCSMLHLKLHVEGTAVLLVSAEVMQEYNLCMHVLMNIPIS